MFSLFDLRFAVKIYFPHASLHFLEKFRRCLDGRPMNPVMAGGEKICPDVLIVFPQREGGSDLPGEGLLLDDSDLA